MFKKDNLETSPDKVDTIIGKETSFKGEISGKGLIRIDGEVDGIVSNKGDVIIGESGKVAVELTARNVTIAGQYEGILEAEGKLELKKTATAVGSFKANDLLIEEGAVISGNMEMKMKEGSELKLKDKIDEKPVKREWSYKPVEAETADRSKGLGMFTENKITENVNQ